MGAFSFVIDTILFLQCGLMFGSNFSPANWEPILQIAEQLATALFNNHTLQEKHKHHLDKLQWDNSIAKMAKAVHQLQHQHFIAKNLAKLLSLITSIQRTTPSRVVAP